ARFLAHRLRRLIAAPNDAPFIAGAALARFAAAGGDKAARRAVYSNRRSPSREGVDLSAGAEMPQRRKKGCLEASPILRETKARVRISLPPPASHVTDRSPRRRCRYEPLIVMSSNGAV